MYIYTHIYKYLYDIFFIHSSDFFFKNYLLILLLAALGLLVARGLFLVLTCGGYSLVAVNKLLIAGVFLVAEHGF